MNEEPAITHAQIVTLRTLIRRYLDYLGEEPEDLGDLLTWIDLDIEWGTGRERLPDSLRQPGGRSVADRIILRGEAGARW